MALIGNLTVGIVANTTKATRNLKLFRAEMSRTAAFSRRAGRAISGFMATFGIGSGIAGECAVLEARAHGAARPAAEARSRDVHDGRGHG